MKKKVYLLVTVLIFTFLFTFARAETYNVDCNKKNKTISKALLEANPGDTIIVEGVCNENITITKDRINLIGGVNSLINGGGKDVITLDSVKGIFISGFTIEDGGFGLLVKTSNVTCNDLIIQNNLGYSGIKVENNSHLTLNGSSVKNNKMGIAVYRSSSLAIYDSECSNNSENNFMRLAQKLLTEAAQIPCSTSEYRDGLIIIRDEILMAVDAAESDLENDKTEEWKE